MSEQANYFKIGSFVILAVVLAIAAVIVFGSGVFEPEPVRIETYFDTTVTGLDVGADFLVRGVHFGDVESIQFADRAYDLDPNTDDALRYGRYVVVVIAMSPRNLRMEGPDDERALYQRLIADGLRLRFAAQGLTGVAYLDGDWLPPDQYGPLEIPWTPRHPYIPSAPSTFGSITESINTLARNLEGVEFKETFEDLRGLLTDIRTTVNNVNSNLDNASMNAIVTSVEDGMQSFRSAMASVEEASASLSSEIQSEESRATLANMEQTTARLPDGVLELNMLLRRFNNYAAASYNDIESTLANLRLISDSVRQLADLAKKYPSQILFGNPPDRSQPGGGR